MSDTEFSTRFKVAKADADKQYVFGWANVSVNKSGDLVVDSQDDIIELVDLEEGAYDFVLSARSTGDMHQGEATGTMIESMVFTPEKLEALGIEKSADSPLLGWWVGFHIEDAAQFEMVKSGDRRMFSIEGTAVGEEVNV